ncbi:MAG: hypothetical protein WD749_04700 [Phycisphaerales bacterium]
MDTVLWTAATCDFRGAGVYLGLAPDYEQIAVCRGLSARQARVFVGGRVVIPPGQRLSITYFAIRDPSAVRVIPIQPAHRIAGFRHVELRIHLGRNGQRDAVVVSPAPNGHGPPGGRPPGIGFLLTIGLPQEREPEFFQSMIVHHPDDEWSRVYTRLLEACHSGGK